MRITRIDLTHVFGFSEFHLDPESTLTVLIGPNNGGKTSILRALKLAFEGFRVVFAGGGEPAQHNLDKPIVTGPGQARERVGTLDREGVFFQRDLNTDAGIQVSGEWQGRPWQFKLEFLYSADQFRLTGALDDSPWTSASPDTRELIRDLYKTAVEFVPAVGSIGGPETLLNSNQLDLELAKGRINETFRNRLQWANEGQPSEFFQRVHDRVSKYIPGVKIKPPSRMRGAQNLVQMTYEEGGINHEVSASGGGLRSLVALASAVELSQAPILLFDEPDSHLHSQIQRLVAQFMVDAADKRQIILSTHAPDFIDAVPIASLRRIDRAQTKAYSCDNVGEELVLLGATSQAQALQSLGCNAILYIENSNDEAFVRKLAQVCGHAQFAEKLRTLRLRGSGDAKYVDGVARVLKAVLGLDVAVLGLIDSDYTLVRDLPQTTIVERQSHSLCLHWPYKEIENIFLNDDTMERAVKEAARRRRSRPEQEEEVAEPSREVISAKIDEISESEEVRKPVHRAWLDQRNVKEPDERSADEIEASFNELFADPAWRRRCCPGKTVMKRLRDWLQSEYGLTLSYPLLFSVYEPAPDVSEVVQKMADYVSETLS